MSEEAFPIGFTFSQSSLQDYTDCPRCFQLRYLDQLAWPAVEVAPVLENERRQQEGKLFHRLVQQHRLGLPVEKITPLASTPALRRWWENYINYDFKLSGWSDFTEFVLSTPIGFHRLVAKYDLLSVHNGKVVIFDWKTYHKRPRDEWMAARLQTRVYQGLLVQAGACLNGHKPFEPEHVEMVYWYANDPAQPARFPYTTSRYTRDWDDLTALINEIIHHRVFAMTEDGRRCSFCPYRSYCNRGIEPGEDADTELEATESEFNFEQIQEIAY